MNATLKPRTECPACQTATVQEVEEDYISNHKLSGVRELQAEDHAAIWDETIRLLEEDRGVACDAHYFDDEA